MVYLVHDVLLNFILFSISPDCTVSFSSGISTEFTESDGAVLSVQFSGFSGVRANGNLNISLMAPFLAS